MIVRLAAPTDAQAVAEIHVESWRHAYRGLLPQDFLDALAPAQRLARWQDLLAEQPDPPRRAILVAVDAADVLGFVRFGPTRDDDASRDLVGEVISLYLRPDTWGRGAGRSLLAEAQRLLTAAGYTSATLWVLDRNDRARRFYAAAGWQPDGAIKQAEIGGTAVVEIRYRTPLP